MAWARGARGNEGERVVCAWCVGGWGGGPSCPALKNPDQSRVCPTAIKQETGWAGRVPYGCWASPLEIEFDLGLLGAGNCGTCFPVVVA